MISYIKYRRRAKHWRGYGIHSPFIFHLITRVFNERSPYYAYFRLDMIRKELGVPKSYKKYGELLFRLVNNYSPRTVFLIGCDEMDAMYIMAADSRTDYVYVPKPETDGEKALGLFSEYGFNRVILRKSLPEALSNTAVPDFIHFGRVDVECVRQWMASVHDKTVFSFSDIYKSKQSRIVWMEAKEMSPVRVSVEWYRLGLLFFNRELQKERYTVIY